MKGSKTLMKNLKKLSGILLAIAVLLACTVTAFAAGPGEIIVDNPMNGKEYKAYKIFDVVYDAENHYSYTIASNSDWLSAVQDYSRDYSTVSLSDLVTDSAGKSFYVVTMDPSFRAADFAKALNSAIDGKTGIPLTTQPNTTVKAEGLDLGYYLVTAGTDTLANLTTTNPSVTIHDKNDVPFNKVDNKDSADVGTDVEYTITGKVPDVTGFTNFKYIITDTMSSGLTFKKDVAVKIGGTPIEASTLAPWIVYGDDDRSFTLDIPVKNYHFGDEIVVTYHATVNENAVAKIESNKAKLTYSNDPATGDTTSTPFDEETVYSSKIVIDKYKTGETGTKLAGAEFRLYKEVESVKHYYKWDDTLKKVVWTTTEAEATIKTTDGSGAASFDGLENGTYYLKEVKAPTGYNLLDASLPVTVAGGATEEQLSVKADVANSTGSLLPSTGGIGTTIFYIVGGVLVAAAVVLLVAKKRTSENR